jgi:hypothetical protein
MSRKLDNRESHPGVEVLTTGREKRSRLSMLTRQILERKGQIGRGLYEIGTRLAHIADDALWEAAGYETFEDYLLEEVQFSRSTAYRLMRISRAFNGRVVARHGVEKLDFAVRYLRAARRKGAETSPANPMQTMVRVREGGRFRTTTLADASVEDIRFALADLRDSTAKPVAKRISSRLREEVRELETSLPPAPEGSHRGNRIRLRRARDGRIAATFHAIPLDELATFVRALQEHGEMNGED